MNSSSQELDLLFKGAGVLEARSDTFLDASKCLGSATLQRGFNCTFCFCTRQLDAETGTSKIRVSVYTGPDGRLGIRETKNH